MSAVKRSKRPDTRPARARYWNGKHLERNKVKRMRQSDSRLAAMPYDKVVTLWREARGKRRMKSISGMVS